MHAVSPYRRNRRGGHARLRHLRSLQIDSPFAGHSGVAYDQLRIPERLCKAHSLGAVVCLAKPYRPERLGHVVKLLAPPPNANDAAPPRAADPSRRHLANGEPRKGPSSKVNRRFRFGGKS